MEKDQKKRVLTRNVKAIDAVKPEAVRVNWTVRGEKGLVFAVHPTGEKTWYVRYQLGSGAKRKRCWYEIKPVDRDGKAKSLQEICDECSEIMGQAKAGLDPAGAVQAIKTAATLDELFTEWLEGHAKANLRTWQDEEQRYKRHIKDALGSRLFGEIEREDVLKLQRRIAKETPVESNRVVALYQRVANWGVENIKNIKINVARGMKKLGQERRRERVMTEDECRKIWRELERPLVVDHAKGGLTEADLPQAVAVRRALQLVFLTGQRRNEVAGIAKKELDLTPGDAWWRLPASRSKNGLAHEVPLGGLAVEIVKSAIANSGDRPFLFPNAEGDGPVDRRSLTRAMTRICRRLGIEKVVTQEADASGKGEREEGIGPHTFRRSIGVALRKAKVTTEDRGHLFNHVSGAKSKVTSWNYDPGEHNDEKRAAQDRWEIELRRVLDGTAKIVPFRTAVGERA